MKKMKLMLESYFEVPKTIKKLRLSWGYFIGGFIGVIILLFFYWISSYIGGWIFNKIADIFNVQEYIGIFKWIITFIVRTVMFAVEYFFFKTLLLGILAPFFSYISEKVENFQDGVKYESSLKENILFVMRGIKIASKSFIKEMVYTLIALLLGFVPVLNLVTPILIFLIQSYFISYNFVDYNLENSAKLVPIKKELEQVKAYVNIEKARFHNRFEIIYDFDEELDTINIPSLTIQPLVENSIKHGILKQRECGIVKISIKKIYLKCLVCIEDNGIGIDQEVINNINKKIEKNIGLKNVHNRLKLIYGKGLLIEKLEKGTKISFYIKQEE